MAPLRVFRALSLDLWFTALYYLPEREHQWTEDRVALLQNGLRTQQGVTLAASAIEAAMDDVHSRLRAVGQGTITVDPAKIIPQYAGALDAELRVPLEEFARRYSAVGLIEHPPIPNPEAVSVVRALTGRGIPVIAITNSARRGSTWQEFLREHMSLDFGHVVSSVDCGAAKPDPPIFEEAARKLGIEAPDILHVGDRWELDVEGALGAGFGAGLYSGLWQQYPEGTYPVTEPASSPGTAVLQFQNLEQLSSGALFRRGDA